VHCLLDCGVTSLRTKAMDLPPKNPWKKGSLVPLSSSKGMIKNNNIDDGKNSINSNNVLGGLEIAGNKIK